MDLGTNSDHHDTGGEKKMVETTRDGGRRTREGKWLTRWWEWGRLSRAGWADTDERMKNFKSASPPCTARILRRVPLRVSHVSSCNFLAPIVWRNSSSWPTQRASWDNFCILQTQIILFSDSFLPETWVIDSQGSKVDRLLPARFVPHSERFSCVFSGHWLCLGLTNPFDRKTWSAWST